MDNQNLNQELDEIETNADKQLQTKNRFQQLANDNRTLAQEKEAAQAEAKASAERVASLEKEASFLKTFSQISSKYPEAANYQEQILDRVNKGLDAEEATLGVLAKEGKLIPQPAPEPRRDAEGGSAMTQLAEGEKSIGDLSTNEKLSALQEMEKSGELTQVLRAGINRS